MDETTSFLEHPLDKSLYTPKKFYTDPKQRPLRVLVSRATGKIAFNLIYMMCRGSVFGKNQEVIIHLQSSKGVLHHRTIALELAECGYPCYKDVVISSDPAVAFKDIDYAIIIITFEEMSGMEVSEGIVHQATKAINFIKNIDQYASENCKVIFTGPVTKTTTIMLGALSPFFSKIPPENISCATCLDTTISKAIIGKKLKTATNHIKNVIIWSNTYPDVSNATIRMYPPDDLCLWEKKELPLIDAIQDDEWIYKTFGLAINRRAIHNDLVTYGKAIAMATAQHLRVIHKGSAFFNEIHSMGVLTPSTEPYGVPKSYGFSYPVFVENGKWKILKDIKVGVSTQINILNTCSKTLEWQVAKRLKKFLKLTTNMDVVNKQTLKSQLGQGDSHNLLKINEWDKKYFITPNPAEAFQKIGRYESRSSKKSIIWVDNDIVHKKLKAPQKSIIRFSMESLKESKAGSKVFNL